MTLVQLKDLRELSVIVVHPCDEDGHKVYDQVNRIGCKVEALWPPPHKLPKQTDVVIVGMSHEYHKTLKALLRRAEQPAPAIIALAEYENAAMLHLMLDLNVLAIISKPVRPFGILTNLVVARNSWLVQRDIENRLNRSENRLAVQKRIAKAKYILMEMQAIGEADAYNSIRAQAMSKRIAINEVAQSIINAHNLLSGSNLPD
jgi:AmiR/NasT family two-component response regulator